MVPPVARMESVSTGVRPASTSKVVTVTVPTPEYSLGRLTSSQPTAAPRSVVRCGRWWRMRGSHAVCVDARSALRHAARTCRTLVVARAGSASARSARLGSSSVTRRTVVPVRRAPSIEPETT